MKKIALVFLFITVIVSAQDYPLTPIYDIQYINDINNVGDIASPLNGDTLTIEGVVLVAPLVNAQTDRRRIIAAGARWSAYIQDKNGQLWGGMNVIQHDTAGQNQNTFWDLADTAQVVRVTGIVEEYITSTQFSILLNPIIPVQVVEQLNERPQPKEVDMSELMVNGVKNLEGEKYEGMYVIVRNLFSSDRNLSNGTFKLNDAEGNFLMMYDQSGFFTLRTHRLTGITDYEPPVDGSVIGFIRGIVTTRDDAYYIVPLYPGDIHIGATPPNISNLQRSEKIVAPNQPMQVSARIVDFDGNVESAQLNYRVNNGGLISVDMTTDNDTLYTAEIPGVALDSALVDYYIRAIDDSNKTAIYPVDTTKNKFFYFVLNRDLTIQDVQYNPFGGGYSSLNGFEVTVSGVVTADTSDLGTVIYIQNGEGPWSGIRLFGTETLKLKKGDLVTVTGTVQEDFNFTQIRDLNEPASVVVNASGVELPEPAELLTGQINLLPNGAVQAEQWEGVLIKYKNVAVIAESADGNSNFGEMLVSDGSGDTRVELQDGNHRYHNLWDPLLYDDPNLIYLNLASTIEELTGVLYFSFSNYKLIPRNNDDFSNVVGVKENDGGLLPSKFMLSQNYPNPFNPSTIINYELPVNGHVSLKIFDILGREVAELVNSQKSAGSYEVNFNAANLSSGVYFYEIRSGSFYSVKKMMLIR